MGDLRNVKNHSQFLHLKIVGHFLGTLKAQNANLANHTFSFCILLKNGTARQRSGSHWAPSQACLERPRRPRGRPNSSPGGAPGAFGRSRRTPGDLLESRCKSRGGRKKLPRIRWEGERALSSAREEFLQTYKIIKKPLIFTLKVNMEVLQNKSIRTKKSSTRPLQPVGHPKKVCGDS